MRSYDRLPPAGVVQVVAVATTAEDSASVLAIARDHPGVFATVGIHPNEAADARAGDWEQIPGNWPDVRRSSPWARPGSTGTGTGPRSRSSKIISDATSTSPPSSTRPVIIHSRDCHRDIVEQLAATRAARPGRPAFVHRHLGRGRGTPGPGPAPLLRRDADLRQQGARPAPRGGLPGPDRPPARRDRLPLPEPSPFSRTRERAGQGCHHRSQTGRDPRHPTARTGRCHNRERPATLQTSFFHGHFTRSRSLNSPDNQNRFFNSLFPDPTF